MSLRSAPQQIHFSTQGQIEESLGFAKGLSTVGRGNYLEPECGGLPEITELQILTHNVNFVSLWRSEDTFHFR